jgi:hypothetical protein
MSDGGSAYFQTGRDRAFRRGGGGIRCFRPPADQLWELRWHSVETHVGLQRVQWRPGIDVWHDEVGGRWTSERAQTLKWRYVGVAEDQSGGLPY